MRSLWQILVAFTDRDRSASLTCDECWQYLQRIAGEAISGASRASMQKAVQEHLVICPDCRGHYLHKLEDMAINTLEPGSSAQND